MASMPYENIKPLIAPIPGKSPAGKDIKYENIYDQIKEASREDLDLPQGVWVHDLKSADWKEAEKLCIDVLTKRSKDFQVAAWLIEAWMSLYQMKGLEAGFNLLAQLSGKYWETGFPALNPNDPEFRAAPFNWINEKLAERFHKIQVTYPEDQDLKVYAYSAYIDLHKDGGVRITKQEEEADKERNPERFQKSIAATKTDFYTMLKQDSATCLDRIKKLQAFLDSKFPEDGPSLYHAQEKVQEISSFAQYVLDERAGKEETDVNMVSDIPVNEKKEEGTAPVPDAKNQADVHVDTVMNSRSEAYAVIEKAANYLEKLDPHSPSPHLIKRAIKWGNLNLHQLLDEMVQDPNTRNELKNLLGIAPDTNPDASDKEDRENPKQPLPSEDKQ